MTVEMNDTNSSTISTIPAVSLPLIAHEPNPFWTFNESADVSKYENFDHSKFMGKIYRTQICNFRMLQADQVLLNY